MRRSLPGTLATTTLLAACLTQPACSKPSPGPTTEPPRTAPMTDATSESDARAAITRAFVARFTGADPDAVQITLYDDGSLPGLRVFQAVTGQPELRTDGQIGMRGVVRGDEVISDPVARLDALVAAMRAKGFDQRPEDFARLAGRLETDGRDPSEALVNARLLERYRTSRPEAAKRMFLPRATTVDGAPAIEYYTLTPVDGREGPTRITMPEGKPIVRSKQGEDGEWKVDPGFDR